MITSFFQVRPSKAVGTAAGNEVTRVTTPTPDEGSPARRPQPKAKAKAPSKPRSKARLSQPLPPEPTQAYVTGMHAMFSPLPPEGNAPLPNESAGQPWVALDETDTNHTSHSNLTGPAMQSSVKRLDNVALANFDDWDTFQAGRIRQDMGDDEALDEALDMGDEVLDEEEDADVLSDCRDYEPESLDIESDDESSSLVSSLDMQDDGLEGPPLKFGAKRGRVAHGLQGIPVYSGPQLICEDADDAEY